MGASVNGKGRVEGRRNAIKAQKARRPKGLRILGGDLEEILKPIPENKRK